MYPEPDSWRHFYEMVSIDRRDRDAMDAVIDKIHAAEAEYVSSEYKSACLCEQNGEIDEAIYHFAQVVMRGDQFPDAKDRYEALQRDYDANAR